MRVAGVAPLVNLRSYPNALPTVHIGDVVFAPRRWLTNVYSQLARRILGKSL